MTCENNIIMVWGVGWCGSKHYSLAVGAVLLFSFLIFFSCFDPSASAACVPYLYRTYNAVFLSMFNNVQVCTYVPSLYCYLVQVPPPLSMLLVVMYFLVFVERRKKEHYQHQHQHTSPSPSAFCEWTMLYRLSSVRI